MLFVPSSIFNISVQLLKLLCISIEYWFSYKSRPSGKPFGNLN